MHCLDIVIVLIIYLQPALSWDYLIRTFDHLCAMLIVLVLSDMDSNHPSLSTWHFHLHSVINGSFQQHCHHCYDIFSGGPVSTEKKAASSLVTAHLRSALVILALSIHSLFEGMAVGMFHHNVFVAVFIVVVVPFLFLFLFLLFFLMFLLFLFFLLFLLF